MVMLHGRGATAEDILSLAGEIDPGGFAYLAPQAEGNQWYPNRFMEPIESNEPWLSRSLGVIEEVLEMTGRHAIPLEKVILLGFSQGACLALEYAARHARRYGGLAGLSGGLIGPDSTPRDYPGSFYGAPAFLGCSDVDPHIPVARVRLTAEVLERMGAAVEVSIYPGMGHLVNADELQHVRAMAEALL